jgi:hypothetical protein
LRQPIAGEIEQDETQRTVLGTTKDTREVELSFFSVVIDLVTTGFDEQRPRGGFCQISNVWVFPMPDSSVGFSVKCTA